VHAAEEAGAQSTPLSTKTEPRTDSAPSMLPPASQSVGPGSVHKLIVSQSLPAVGMAQAVQPVDGHRDVINVGANPSDTSDVATCRDGTATSGAVSSRTDTAAAITQPRLSHVAEAKTQPPPTVASSAAAAAGTATADADADAAAGSCVKCFHNEAIESADLTVAECCKVTECNDMMMVDAATSDATVTAESEADEVSSAAEPTAMYMDQDSNSFTLAASDLTESGSRRAFAALGPAAVDKSVDMSVALRTELPTQSDSTGHPVLLTVDEETNMPAAMDDQLGQLSATMDDVGTPCCDGAVADDGSNGESHSTLDDMQLVRSLHRFLFYLMLHIVQGVPKKWNPDFNFVIT